MEKLILWHRLAARGRDDASEPGEIASWARAVRARLSAAGGTILAQVSGTVVGEFDPSDAADVLEAALDLLGAADEASMSIALGIALGAVEDGAGRAIEVAELLATRAQAGELVLDPAARDRAEGLFLFGRQVSTGVGGPRGAAIDRAHPRREGLAEAIAHLRPPPIAPITATLVPGLAALAQGDPLPAIVLRGPVGAGAVELVAEAALVARARSLITIGSAPGGIVPLASLRLGLARAFGSDEAIVAACGTDDEGRTAGRILRTTLRGGMPPREALSAALGLFLARIGDDARDGASWVFVTPLAMADVATVDVLLEARERGAPIVIVARYPIDARLPGGIAEPVHEITLPPLRTSDARAIAEVVLGEGTDADVARRVAVLGGETPLGVVEVARALIATGDLVLQGDAFEWRGPPRGGASAIPIEEVVDERLERLDDEMRRTLEAICVVPEGAARDLIEAVALRDGINEKARSRSLDRLGREGWLAASGQPDALHPERPHPSSSFLRRFVLQGMPPSRHAELHRFVAEALLERGADDPSLPSLRAEVAWYEIEGGIEQRGARTLADIARIALENGYRRAAARIATLLAKLGAIDAVALSRAAATIPPVSAWEYEPSPPSSEIVLDGLVPATLEMQLPAEQAQRVRAAVPRSEPAGASSFVAAAEDAVRRHDPAALESLLQRAVVSGSDMAAVARIRALADLLRGDVGGARRSLAKARGYPRARGPADPRESLAEAAVTLGGGDPAAAIRLGLRALSLARRASDRRGEVAALRMLAACYRALGREPEAKALEAVAA